MLNIEHINARRSASADYINTFRKVLAYKLENGLSYDIIMTGDDNALRFSLSNHASLFQQKPIIFFGVQDTGRALHQNTNPRVTGLADSLAMEETITLMMQLHPQTKWIIALSDGTESKQGDLKEFYRIASKQSDPIIFSDISLEKCSFDEFLDALSVVPSQSIVLLLSARQDKQRTFHPFYESLKQIKQHLKAPLYHLWRHGIGDGIIGGKVNCPYETARAAAQMVKEVQNGRALHTIPVVQKNTSRYVFDYNELEKQGISTSQLPKGALVINQPLDFLRKYNRIIWGVAAFSIAQAVILFLLAVNILRRRRSEQALAQSEYNYRLIIQHQNDLVVRLDPDMRIVLASPSYCQTFGKSEAEIVGKRFFPFLHKDDRERTRKSLMSLTFPPYKTYHEERAMTPKGWRWFGWSARAVLDEKGRVADIISVGRDMTRQKESEKASRENEERLRTLINAMPDIVCFKDGKGRWLEANNFYLRLIDITPQS